MYPWNSFAEPTGEAAFLPRELIDGASPIGGEADQAARRLRSVAVAPGNRGSPEEEIEGRP